VFSIFSGKSKGVLSESMSVNRKSTAANVQLEGRRQPSPRMRFEALMCCFAAL
jgi:hypothetical protein